MFKTLYILFLVISISVQAQDTTKTKTNPLTLSAYIDLYYCYDAGEPASHLRPTFFYSYNRHNEVNLNFGMIKAAYETDKARGNLAFMAGTYAQYNMIKEQGLLKNVYEANFGLKISNKKNVWVDAGIMPSHIGFESAIGKDCWNLTRSILADNSPYFETGVKLGATSKNEKWYTSIMYLNGWQNIQRNAYNQTPAFGTQLMFKPKANTVLNWSTFIGNSYPDSAQKWRFFNNFYGQFPLTKKFGMIAGFDIGLEQRRDTLHKMNGISTWYAPLIILRYAITTKAALSARVEYYSDKDHANVSYGNPLGFRTFGYSLNYDLNIRKNLMWRIEGRALQSDEEIFTLNGKASDKNYFVTTSMNLSF